MRHRRVVVVGLVVGLIAVLVSPAAGSTAGWTAGRLTAAVKSLMQANAKDDVRDERQADRIRTQAARLAALKADLRVVKGQVASLRRFRATQRALNAGIVSGVESVTSPSEGCPHGGYRISFVGRDSVFLCHGKDEEEPSGL